MNRRRYLSDVDFLLFGAVAALAVIGLFGVYSAAPGDLDRTVFLRQMVWILLGSAVCLALSVGDYRFITHHAFLIYAGVLLTLVLVLFYGAEVNHTRSWLGIAGIGAQPSELAKVVAILALARYLGEIDGTGLKRRDVVVSGLLILLPVVLVTMQGDLGTALMFVPILLGVLLVAGMKLRSLVWLLVLCLCLAPVGWMFLKDYQKQRILVTFDPDLDPQGYGYQVRQSQIAIGSGGILGKGKGEALQSRLGFVPEVQTDFIFALLAEETGLLGAGLILMLYLFVLVRLLRIAEAARDRVGIFVVAGVASLIFSHVLVNVGMTLGLSPSIGIPLPLLSYGGSATVSTFAAVGLALNVYFHRFVH